MCSAFNRLTTKDILICEDHPFIQVGLKVCFKELFVDVQNFRIASTGKGAIDLVREKHPDLAVLDLGLPDMSGIDLIQKLKEISPCLKILLLTSCDDPSTLSAAKKLEVQGILRKGSSPECLEEAFNFMESNPTKIFLDSSVASLLKEYGEINFTPQEYKVLQGLVQGLSNPQIAGRLSCSVSTVRFHRANILQKTNIRTGAALRAWFLNWKGQSH